jgi:hypothetical protein
MSVTLTNGIIAISRLNTPEDLNEPVRVVSEVKIIWSELTGNPQSLIPVASREQRLVLIG